MLENGIKRHEDLDYCMSVQLHEMPTMIGRSHSRPPNAHNPAVVSPCSFSNARRQHVDGSGIYTAIQQYKSSTPPFTPSPLHTHPSLSVSNLPSSFTVHRPSHTKKPLPCTLEDRVVRFYADGRHPRTHINVRWLSRSLISRQPGLTLGSKTFQSHFNRRLTAHLCRSMAVVRRPWRSSRHATEHRRGNCDPNVRVGRRARRDA